MRKMRLLPMLSYLLMQVHAAHRRPACACAFDVHEKQCHVPYIGFRLDDGGELPMLL